MPKQWLNLTNWNPCVYFKDELNNNRNVFLFYSALDSESEHYVKEALDRLMVGRTVITIAHRLSTIKSANQIAVLDNGQVAELGTYTQLTAMPDGIFRKLVEKQTITSWPELNL